MRVRTATKDDAPLLAELNRDVQQLHVDALPNIYKQVDDLTLIAEDFNTRILADPEWHTYIVEVEGEAAGYVCAKIVRRPEHAYSYAREYVYVDQISVRSEYRNSGCGRALMDAVYDFARSMGLRRVALDTLAFNTGAIAFYERLGFRMFKHTMELELRDERHNQTL